METSSSTLDQALLDELRQRRAELRDSISALESALATPPSAGRAAWAERVHVALVELSADVRAHIDVTEGDRGLYRELLAGAPRLSGAVARLTEEHEGIRDGVEALLARVQDPDTTDDLATVRELGTSLLGTLVRHRQRGSDLVYEAYEIDVGGET